MPQQSGRNWVLLFIFFALTVALLAFVFVDELLGEASGNLYLVAPVQVVLGSVVFLLGITAVVAVFARLGLQDKRAALALPEGSVRALLALILLIVFVIFGNIIYGQTKQMVASTVSFAGLTEQQVEQLPGPVLIQQCVAPPVGDQGEQAGSIDSLCSGTYQQEVPNSERQALGLQIITALLTLVTAIASFYFGAKVATDNPSVVPGGDGRGDGPVAPGATPAVAGGAAPGGAAPGGGAPGGGAPEVVAPEVVAPETLGPRGGGPGAEAGGHVER